jgi:hypothetical protein
LFLVKNIVSGFPLFDEYVLHTTFSSSSKFIILVLIFTISKTLPTSDALKQYMKILRECAEKEDYKIAFIPTDERKYKSIHFSLGRNEVEYIDSTNMKIFIKVNIFIFNG